MATGIYWKRLNPKEAWKYAAEDSIDDLIERKGAAFTTWMAFDSEPPVDERDNYDTLGVVRYGDLPLDFDDSKNISTARNAACLAAEHLNSEYGLSFSDIDIYISGSKGFHLVISRYSLGSEDGDILLPLIYKELVSDWFPKGNPDYASLDMCLYCMGKGRMFRLPNVKRDNGKYKVRISYDELKKCTVEELDELCSSPRPIPVRSKPIEPNVKLMKEYLKKRSYLHDMARTQRLPKKALVVKEKEIFPCTKMLLSSASKLSADVSFNQICFSAIVPSMIEAGFNHDEILYVPEVERFLEQFENSESYTTFNARQEHLKSVIARDKGHSLGFSCGAMLKCLGKNGGSVCATCKPRINAWLAAEEAGKVESEEAESEISQLDSNPDVDRLLKTYAWVQIGGKEAVAFKSPSTNGYEFFTRKTFEGLYANRPPIIQTTASGKIKEIPVATAWLKHPKRKTFPNGIFFDPSVKKGGGNQDGRLNLWCGFPMALPTMTKEEASEGCKLFRHHVEHIICGDRPESIQFVWAWLSDMVKRPGGKKPGSALVLVGGKGVGKSTVALPFRKIMGYYCSTISSPDRLLTNFNAGLADKILLVLEEAVWGGSHEAESRLKSLITEQDSVVERKGFDSTSAKTFQRIIMCSNADWVVPASSDERRFCVLKIEAEKPSIEYFERLNYEIDNGGAEALYAWLNYQNLENVCLYNPPRTIGLDAQKLESLDSTAQWWFDCLFLGAVPVDSSFRMSAEWSDTLDPNIAFESYSKWCDSQKIQHRATRRVLISKIFGKSGISGCGRTYAYDKETKAQRWMYQVGDIETARVRFTQNAGLTMNFSWEDAADFTHAVKYDGI